MKRSWWAWLALASLIVARSPATHGARPRYGGTLRAEIQATSVPLDPAGWSDEPAIALDQARVSPLVFETLVGLDASGRVVPRLATSWQRNPRGTRWDLQIRPGVRLHDGSTLDAARAAASLRRTSPGWNAREEAGTLVLDVPGGADGIEWALADPRNGIAVPADGGPVGTGPFRIERWEPGRAGLLRAHDAYWGGRPFIDAVQVEFGRRLRDQLADLEQGRADLVSVLPQDARRVSQRGSRLAASAPLALAALVFDPSRPAGANAELRRAVALSIDRTALCQVLLQRQGEPAHALLPQWLSGYAFLAHPTEDRPAARAAVRGLPVVARGLQAQVDPIDAVLQAIGERLAVDARDAGLTVAVVPGRPGSAADARLVRQALVVSSPDRAFAALTRALGVVDSMIPGADETPPGASSMEVQARRELSLVERHLVVPLVHLPELYGVNPRLAAGASPLIGAAGGWQFRDAWFRPE